MKITTTCRSCGREFEPTPTQIQRGRWQRCSDCAGKPPKRIYPPPRPVPDDDEWQLVTHDDAERPR